MTNPVSASGANAIFRAPVPEWSAGAYQGARPRSPLTPLKRGSRDHLADDFYPRSPRGGPGQGHGGAMARPWRIGKQGASGPSERRRKQTVGRPFAKGVEKWVSRQRSQEIGPFHTKCSTPASEPSHAARFPGDPPFGVESSPSDMWHLGGLGSIPDRTA